MGELLSQVGAFVAQVEGDVGVIGRGLVLGLPETLAQEEETQTEQPVEEEEHNPILPEADELIFGSLAFLLVFVVLARYAFPRLNQGLKQREEKIRGDLERAEEARGEAGRIIEESRRTADSMRRDLLAKAEDESRAVVARAQEEIRAERDRAIQELRSQLAEWSVELAARVVGASLDKTRPLQLVEEYIDEVAAMGNGGAKPTRQRGRKAEE